MRLHVNLKNMAASRMVKLHRILIVAGKLAWPRYDLDTDYSNPLGATLPVVQVPHGGRREAAAQPPER